MEALPVALTHQIQVKTEDGLSKYYDETSASYSYPYNNPAKVYVEKEEEKVFSKKMMGGMRVVANPDETNCLKIRITTGTIEEEEKEPKKKKKKSSKKPAIQDTTETTSVGVTKSVKTKPQHHPMFAKFFARSRLLRK